MIDSMAELDDITNLIDSTGNGYFDQILRFGLFIGAIFQLVCIFAVIFIPSQPGEKNDEDAEDTTNINQATKVTTLDSQQEQSSHTAGGSGQHKTLSSNRLSKRQEKKKKR